MLARVWRNWNPCTSLKGIHNGSLAVKTVAVVSKKQKHRLLYDPAIPLLKRRVDRYMYIYVNSSIIHSRQNVETAQMFIKQ